MADSDSFINEVTEEVRRDRLFAFFRRWGWAFALGILVIVGAAAYSEFRRAQTERTAEALGDAVIGALDAADPADRIAALEAIGTDSTGAEMLLTLLIAGQETEAGEHEAAAERLRAVAARSDMPDRYRELALLKAHMLAPGPRGEAMAMLDRLSQPGAPYRPLAIEQTAYMMIADGDEDGGLALLEDLLSEAGTTPGLQERVRQLMLALQTGASLSDEPLPEPELDALQELLELPLSAPEPPDEDATEPVASPVENAAQEGESDGATEDETAEEPAQEEVPNDPVPSE